MDAAVPNEQCISPVRWWIHVALYALGPLLIAALPLLDVQLHLHWLEPGSVTSLLWMSFVNLAMFGIIWMSAWLAARANFRDLLFIWRGKAMPVLLGALYSVALRFALFVIVFMVVLAIVIAKGPEPAKEFVQSATPQPGKVLPVESMVHDPLYLLFCLTFLSFVVAGFREEVWRSGMMLGLRRVLPTRVPERWKQAISVVISSLIFGIGHVTQGWGAVAMAALLGVGFGLIIMFHRSIWEATLAHGFFDATSFAVIYLVLKYLPGAIPGL